MINRSRKGGRVERIVTKWLESNGYHVRIPALLSRSAFDRVAIRSFCTKHKNPGPCRVQPTDCFNMPGENYSVTLYDCAFITDERWIQIKSNDWDMGKAHGGVRKAALHPHVPEHATREFIRRKDHPNEKFDPMEHLACRRVYPDGTWEPWPLLPEWA